MRAPKPELQRFATRSIFRPARIGQHAAFRNYHRTARRTTAILGRQCGACTGVGRGVSAVGVVVLALDLGIRLDGAFRGNGGVAPPRSDSLPSVYACLDQPARSRLLQLAAIPGAANFDRSKRDTDRCFGTGHHSARWCGLFFHRLSHGGSGSALLYRCSACCGSLREANP